MRKGGDSAKGDSQMQRKLTPEEEMVIVHKGTEPAFSGKFNKHRDAGVYTCRRCGAGLFSSADKFDSGTGWPSFDDAIPGAVERRPDADATRTEIVCAACGAHLGHVFEGEGMTARNTRHCVNSISLDFVPAAENKTQRAIFASGCFWGTEYFLRRAKGGIKSSV
ncbi:MAG: methionine-R-sulfoxide reductase, partial [Planctomycetia bacterium]|nr:methionine-R-sulfoxide reductase [Planctomycetia bacterium]